MGSHGIKDRVAIIGMGCTRFVEHWNLGLDDLLIDAANEAYASAGIDKSAVDAYWLGTAEGGMSGITAGAAPCSSSASRSRVWRTTAPPAPRRCDRPAMRWRRARTTSPWPSASRRPRIPATRACRRRRRRTTALRARSPPPRCSRWSLPPTRRSTASTSTSCARRWRTWRGRTTTTVPATRARSSGARSRWRRSATRRRWPASSVCSIAPAWPTAPPPRSCAGPKTRSTTPTSRCT